MKHIANFEQRRRTCPQTVIDELLAQTKRQALEIHELSMRVKELELWLKSEPLLRDDLK